MDKLREIADLTRKSILNYAKTEFKQPSTEDLGDYIPFLAFFGEKEICDKHIHECSPELFEPTLPTQREDTLLGLIEYYRLTRDEESLQLARKYVEYLFSHYADESTRIVIPVSQFIQNALDNDKLGSKINRFSKIVLKTVHSVLGTKTAVPRNGVFIELLIDMFDLTQEQKYLNLAESFASTWLNSNMFTEFSLFPSFRLNPIGDRYATLAKDNTNLLNGLVALYKETHKETYRNAILAWCESVHTRCFEGTVYGKYYFGSGKKEKPESFYAMAVIDVLSYAYFVTKEKWLLDFAEKIAKFWIELQSDIGLFPVSSSSQVSIQDDNTDLCVSLWGLNELTGNDLYLKASRKAMEGLFKFHTFHMQVDYKSGEPLDNRASPKYVFLMSKPIILLEVGTIYNNKKIFKLLRDR